MRLKQVENKTTSDNMDIEQFSDLQPRKRKKTIPVDPDKSNISSKSLLPPDVLVDLRSDGQFVRYAYLGNKRH